MRLVAKQNQRRIGLLGLLRQEAQLVDKLGTTHRAGFAQQLAGLFPGVAQLAQDLEHPLDHRADMTLQTEADPCGARGLHDVAQGLQSLACARVDRLWT